MYGVAYDTGRGFGSLGLVGDVTDSTVVVGDPILGTQRISVEDCYHVFWSESGAQLPFCYPVVSDSMISDGLYPRPMEMVANQQQLAFLSGYPIAWEKVRVWREGLAPDWRTVAIVGIFARSTMGTVSSSVEKRFRLFGPILKKMLDLDEFPTEEELLQIQPLRELGLYTGRAKSFLDIVDYAPWLAERMETSKDYTRRFRNRTVALRSVHGLGLPKLTFMMAICGRDGACLDRRILDHWFAPKDAERLKSLFSSSPQSPVTIKKYMRAEERMKNTLYWDPSWPMPYAKAQWMLWETLGRTPGPVDHSALWDVLGL